MKTVFPLSLGWIWIENFPFDVIIFLVFSRFHRADCFWSVCSSLFHRLCDNIELIKVLLRSSLSFTPRNWHPSNSHLPLHPFHFKILFFLFLIYRRRNKKIDTFIDSYSFIEITKSVWGESLFWFSTFHLWMTKWEFSQNYVKVFN